MRFIKRLTGVLCLLLLLAACTKAIEEPSTQSELDLPAELSEEIAPPETVDELEDASIEVAFTHLQAVPFSEEERFAMRGVAADYVLDYDSFYDQYNRDDLFAAGIADAASFVVGESRAENLVGDSVLIFTGDHVGAIAGDIGIGTGCASVVDAFGEPAARYKEDALMLYKTATFYLAFAGDPVEAVYLARRVRQPETEELLPLFLSSKEKHSFPYQDWGMYGAQLWRGSMTYYSPGGLCIWSTFDRDMNDVYPITIYSDYEGLVPENLGEEGGMFFQSIDYPEHRILRAIAENNEIERLIASESEPSWESDLFSARFFSPNGAVAVLEYDLCTYERSGYLLRYLDGSHADRFLQFGHFPTHHGWIGDRYLLVGSMLGFGIYDVRSATGEPSCRFYLKDESYAGPWVVEAGAESIIIRGEEYIVSQPGMDDVPLALKSDQELHIAVSQRDEALAISYEVREIAG